ncbi:methyltransferase [Streptomyces lasalocidi]
MLEVGSGYGTLTGRLLPLFPAERTDYLFTDISPFFTDRARRVFAEYDFVRYGMLNLDRAPQLQGHEGLSADLVIAASMLHDTRRIDDSLRTLRSVLAPGGTLLLVEQTHFHPWYDLLMGLQQGFDGYEDTQLRTEHPLLDREQWDERLRAAGFTGTGALTSGALAEAGLDVIAAQGPLEQSRFDTEALRAYLAERLPKHMVPSRLIALDRLPLNHTGKVDRGALAQVGSSTAAQPGKSVPPVTDRQFKLVALYREVLGAAEMDLASDFLDAGGDSLLAARIAVELQRAFDVTVPIGTILQHPTVAAIDQWLELRLGPSTPPTVHGTQEQA